jgi:2-amino-4-hydroxy-6-hydroxymethyldihydropteridine diphosphokinase
MARCYLGLGSNLGDREANLARAVTALGQAPGVRVLRRSGLYETEPVGPSDQPWYLNAVVEVDVTLEPEALRRAAKRLETELGRTPGPRWGPRVIDVDILLYDSLRLRTPELVIPHPEWWNRLFVLVPLAELRSDLVGPDGEPIGGRIEVLARASPQVRAYRPRTDLPLG